MNVGPYDSQLMEMQHGQRLADMLRMNAMQPIQSVSNSPLASISPLQVMAQALMGYSANRAGEKHMEDMRNLSQMMEGDKQAGLAQFNEEYPVDPSKAVFNLLAARSPVLQEMGKTLSKGLVTPKDLSKSATHESILASGGNPAGFSPIIPLETVEPGKPLMNKQTGAVVNPTSIQPGATPNYQTINGDLYGITPTGMDQINKAPRITNNNSINTAQNHGLKEYFGNANKSLEDLKGKAVGAVNTLRALNELKSMEDSGIFSNVTSGPSTFIANLAQAFGMPISDEMAKKLGSTESYNAAATDLWQTLVSKYGGNRGVTKEEAEQIRKILPLASNSPEARKFIVDTLSRAANRQINDFSTANQAFAEAVQNNDISKLAPIMERVMVPNQTDTRVPAEAPINQPPTPQVRKFADLIKEKGIK